MSLADYFAPVLVIILLFSCLCLVVVHYVTGVPRAIKVHSCACGAHWWIKKWLFWRHMDASPFNDKLQDRWTIWMFEFRDVLVLTPKEQARMGYPAGPVWEDGRTMWGRSKWQLSISPASYCARCALHGQ